MKIKAFIGAALAALFLFALTASAESAENTPPTVPAGTGTVIDSGTDEDGKEFYTIQTPDEAVFYLIIDRQRGAENVYFLDAVAAKDLLSLVKPDAEPSDTPTTTMAVAQPEAPAQPAQQGFSNLWLLLAALVVVAVSGGAGYYFKIYRPRHQAPELDGDDSNEPAPWEEDTEMDEETEDEE